MRKVVAGVTLAAASIGAVATESAPASAAAPAVVQVETAAPAFGQLTRATSSAVVEAPMPTVLAFRRRSPWRGWDCVGALGFAGISFFSGAGAIAAAPWTGGASAWAGFALWQGASVWAAYEIGQACKD